MNELIAIRDQYQEQLRAIDSFDEQIGLLESQLDASYKELLQQASVLSEQRKVASTAMASQLVKMIIPLGMPNTRFLCGHPSSQRAGERWNGRYPIYVLRQ